MDKARVTGSRLLAAGRFLTLTVLQWVDGKGTAHEWESADRTVGAVLVIPRLQPSDRLLIIRQFRPPAGGVVLEFPAGLLNPGEAPEDAARRELHEETGYQATAVVLHPPAFTSPGLSNETVYMVEATIDENAPENTVLETAFDPSENIENILVPFRDLGDFYRRETARGTLFDAKLAGFLLGRPG